MHESCGACLKAHKETSIFIFPSLQHVAGMMPNRPISARRVRQKNNYHNHDYFFCILISPMKLN